jgi:hypothetical protein
MSPADLLNFGEQAFIAATDKQNLAVEFTDLKLANDLDCIRVAKRQIQNYQIGVTPTDLVQELLRTDKMTGTDSNPAEHFANDRPNLRLIIKHKGQTYTECFRVQSHSKRPPVVAAYLYNDIY